MIPRTDQMKITFTEELTVNGKVFITMKVNGIPFDTEYMNASKILWDSRFNRVKDDLLHRFIKRYVIS